MQKTNKEKKDSFNEIIKSKLENYSLPVDDNCWNEIETRLASQPQAKRSVLLPWISGVAAAACIALIWILFPLTEKPAPNSIAELPVPEEIIPAPVVTPEDNAATIPPPRKHQQRAKSPKIEETNPITEAVAMTDAIAMTEPVEKDKPGNDSADKPNIPEKKEPDKKEIYEKFYAYKEDVVLPDNHRSSPKTNTFGVHLGSGGNLLAMNSSDNSGAIPQMNGPNGSAFLGDDNSFSKNTAEYSIENLFSDDDFSNITHHAPISLGLSFKKDLNNTFALESGLIYTFLSSKFENQNPKKDANLYLHYLGIPLNLQTRLYTAPNEKWRFYLSTGVTVEKGLLASYSQTEYFPNTILKTSDTENIDGLQWSLNASLGVDYKLNKNYSIYFEPKIGYYVENNQPISARTENPLIIGVNLGFRYNW